MPTFTVVALKCVSTAPPPKSLKLVFFGINLPKRGIPLKRFFFTIFGMEEGVPGQHPHVKFHRCGLKVWAYIPQNRQNGNYWYNFAPKCAAAISNLYVCPSIVGIEAKLMNTG